jgi:hypothetical protein
MYHHLSCYFFNPFPDLCAPMLQSLWTIVLHEIRSMLHQWSLKLKVRGSKTPNLLLHCAQYHPTRMPNSMFHRLSCSSLKNVNIHCFSKRCEQFKNQYSACEGEIVFVEPQAECKGPWSLGITSVLWLMRSECLI